MSDKTIKKGICLNVGNCDKANTKEVITVQIGEDFVCPDCCGELVEIKDTPFPPTWVKIVAGAVVIVGIVAAVYFSVFSGGEKTPPLPSVDLIENENQVQQQELSEESNSVSAEREPVETTETTEPEKTEVKKEESKPTATNSAVTKTTVSVKGGSYIGEVKNGKPHGQGTLTYNSRTRVSTRDMKERYAEAGQYIIGEFYEGELVQGKLFDKDNEPIESIILGRPH